ncbi:unnamed protein product [Amoebophrya sp. A25]|nr:unnamed protein product [Amoebophrya sp. A25]|eukprot:GSA25T00016610001.1
MEEVHFSTRGLLRFLVSSAWIWSWSSWEESALAGSRRIKKKNGRILGGASSICDKEISDSLSERIRNLVMSQEWQAMQQLITQVHTDAENSADKCDTKTASKQIFTWVRDAVDDMKSEADDLKRIVIDKKYLEKKNSFTDVRPAFQWAQNKTHLFLLIKMSARWNAPGALKLIRGPGATGMKTGSVVNSLAADEKTGASIVVGTSGSAGLGPFLSLRRNEMPFELNFTAYGQISATKYRYSLNLPLWDGIYSANVVLNSVGKFLVTIEKTFPGRWKTLTHSGTSSTGGTGAAPSTRTTASSSKGRTTTMSATTSSSAESNNHMRWAERQEIEDKKEFPVGKESDDETAGDRAARTNRKDSPASCEPNGQLYCRARDHCVLDCAISCSEDYGIIQRGECSGRPIIDGPSPDTRIRVNLSDEHPKRSIFSGLMSVEANWGIVDEVDVHAAQPPGTTTSASKAKTSRLLFTATREKPRFQVNALELGASAEVEITARNVFGQAIRPVTQVLVDMPYLPEFVAVELVCEDLNADKKWARYKFALKLWEDEKAARDDGSSSSTGADVEVAEVARPTTTRTKSKSRPSSEASSNYNADLRATDYYKFVWAKRRNSAWETVETKTITKQLGPDPFGRIELRGEYEENVWTANMPHDTQAPSEATHVVAMPYSKHGAGPVSTWVACEILDDKSEDQGAAAGPENVDVVLDHDTAASSLAGRSTSNSKDENLKLKPEQDFLPN